MRANTTRLGEWTPSRLYEATHAEIAAYAAAVGSAAPTPLFGVVPAREPMLEAQRAVVPEDVRVRTSVHGEHDFFLNRVIEPGMTLSVRAAVVGLHVVSAGTQVVTKTETTLPTREPVDVQYWTMLLRGIDLGWSGGELPPAKPATPVDGACTAHITSWVAPTLSRAYAEATGDKDAYVLDETAARAAGFPGVILHGLCTLGLATGAVMGHCGTEPIQLRRIGVRFTHPLLLGQEITTVVTEPAVGAGARSCSFEVVDAAGTPVIRRGIAEFRE
jgi:acyl dehydratase